MHKRLPLSQTERPSTHARIWRLLLSTCLFMGLTLATTAGVAFAHTRASQHHLVDLQTHSGGPYSTQPDPCLSVTFYNVYNGGLPNTASFEIGIYNGCPWQVNSITGYWSLTSYCGYNGSGDSSGAFPVPNIGKGAKIYNTLSWNSYCVGCSQGKAVDWPVFSIDVAITQMRGVSSSGIMPVTMAAGNQHEDSAIMPNDARNSGGIRCP